MEDYQRGFRRFSSSHMRVFNRMVPLIDIEKYNLCAQDVSAAFSQSQQSKFANPHAQLVIAVVNDIANFRFSQAMPHECVDLLRLHPQ